MSTKPFCHICRKTLNDSERFYCDACRPVAFIIYNSVDDAVRHNIPNANRDVCTRALDLENAKEERARKSIIRALHRRIRKLDKAGVNGGAA